MSRIVIEGIKPWDGEYELEEERVFNAREWRWIKKISGYTRVTVQEGFVDADPDLHIALAVIAMCRDGKIDRDSAYGVAEAMAEVPFDGIIDMVGDQVEDDALPPELTSEPDESSAKSSLENDNSPKPKTSSPGNSSKTDSAPSDKTPPSTGESGSDTSSASALTSVAS